MWSAAVREVQGAPMARLAESGNLGRSGDRRIGRSRRRARRFAGHDRRAASPHRDIEGSRGERPDDELERDHDPEHGLARTAARGVPVAAVRKFGRFDAIGRPRGIARALRPHALTTGLGSAGPWWPRPRRDRSVRPAGSRRGP